MAEYEVKLSEVQLSNLLSGKEGLAELLESVLNQVLEAQAIEQLGADRYERTEELTDYCNGYRPRRQVPRLL